MINREAYIGFTIEMNTNKNTGAISENTFGYPVFFYCANLLKAFSKIISSTQ